MTDIWNLSDHNKRLEPSNIIDFFVLEQLVVADGKAQASVVLNILN